MSGAVGAGIKLPTIASFSSAEDVVAALNQRDTAVLAAGLVQVEKSAFALLAKAAPRAEQAPILDYLAKFPTTDGVFAAWDTAHKTNNSQLSAAVLSALSALIRLVSTDPFASEPEIIRRLLSQYGTHLDRALNPGRNDVTVAALKLCNVVVGFGSGRFARRLFGAMQWLPKIMTRLFKTRLRDTSRDPLLKPDIRTLLTMLILAFLAAGDTKLKVQVLEMKSLTSGILKGLSEDPQVVVNQVLVTLHRDVVEDRSIPLEARRGLFDEPSVVELIKLYDQSSEEGDEDQAPRLSINRFLYAVSDWLAIQVNESLTRSFGPQKVLGTILRTLKVADDPLQRELGLYILGRAPILSGQFWARFPSSLDPRLSSRWISTITFATQVVSLPVPVYSSTVSPTSLSSLLPTILPPSLTKVWFAKALQHESPLVSFLSSIFLLASMQKASKVLELLAENSKALEEDGLGSDSGWKGLAGRLRESLRSVLPDPQVVVALVQKSSVEEAKKKESESDEMVVEEVGDVKAKADVKSKKSKKATVVIDNNSPRHLRTNVALRLLWLYHRTVPSLISMLRYDFSKLPQAHVKPTEDAEGIRAISSAYALRLAAAHSSGGWYKPGEFFRSTLIPLFKLYRTPSTPSNRHLLFSILSKLLNTPALFGPQSSSSDSTNQSEVDIWLAALPIPTSSSSASSTALDFVQNCVQKTLTARPELSNGDASTSFQTPGDLSPLLRTFIADLPGALDRAKVGDEQQELSNFVRLLALGFMGYEKDKGVLGKILDAVGEAVDGETRELLQHCFAVLSGTGNPLSRKPSERKMDSTLSSPISSNIFVGELELEQRASLATNMPTVLLFLHAQASTLVDNQLAPALIDLVATRLDWISASQTLLHRLLSSSWSEEERGFVGSFLTNLLATCGDEKVQQEVKARVFGPSGLLETYKAKNAPSDSITRFIGFTLSPASSSDTLLAEPYCALVRRDVEAVASQRETSKSKILSGRISSSSPLLPFLSTDSAIYLGDVLLSAITLPLDPSNRVLLDNVLLHLAALPWTLNFHQMWTNQFLKLHALATVARLASAATVMAKGADALLPFSPSAATVKSSPEWRDHVDEWSAALLEGTTINPAQAKVLAALVYRSSSSRARFVTWLNAQAASSSTKEFADGAEVALQALLEVSEACGSEVQVVDSIAVHFTERILDGAPTAVENAALRKVLGLMCRLSGTASAAVRDLLVTRIPAIDRDSYSAGVALFLSELSSDSPVFLPALELFVNGSFAGLVRRFAEDDEDTEVVSLLVENLRLAVGRHGKRLTYKTHLLDPLITATITRRLNILGPISLAALLCESHTWKESEATRLLNHVLASSHFQPRISLDPSVLATKTATLKLVSRLASSSLEAAASSRLVEKLMPFYGGTTSSDDIALLDLFQRLELVSGNSLAVAFRLWNPSLDQSPLESSRAAALASLQQAYTRRSWLRACASSRTRFALDQDDLTYDPNFILPYLRQTLVDDELKAQEWTGILESGVLGVALAGLASSTTSLRIISRATLATALKKAEASTFREKEEVLLVFTQAKNCIFSQVGEPIPAVTALFLAHCIAMVGTPESPLYPAINSFLLQRPLLDQRDVPMFYLLLYSAGEDPAGDHKWILRFLGDALVRTQDWRIYRRRQTFELLASLFQSKKTDLPLRKLILQFIVRATSIPKAAQELFSKNGLLQWLAVQKAADAGERRLLAEIIDNVVAMMVHAGVGDAADVLDALAVLYAGVDALPTSELTSLCGTIRKVVARLPSASTSSMPTQLVLDRARNLLSLASSNLGDDTSSQLAFYLLAMTVEFTRHRLGLKATVDDMKLFSEAVRAGLAAGVEDLRKEALRSFATSST